jgi:hypothetical protein
VRNVTVLLGGAATPGDVVNLGYAARRGGKTTTGYLVVAGDDLAAVATGLARGVNTDFCQPLFAAKATGEALTILVADAADDVTFSGFCEHVAGPNHTMRSPGGSATIAVTE